MKDTPNKVPTHVFRRWLIVNDACEDALDWCIYISMKEAWMTCERPGWMFWALRRAGLFETYHPRTNTLLSRMALDMINCTTVQDKHLLDFFDDSQREVVHATKRYCDGELTWNALDTISSKMLCHTEVAFSDAMRTDFHYRNLLAYNLVTDPLYVSDLSIQALNWTLYMNGHGSLTPEQREHLRTEHADCIRRYFSWHDIQVHMMNLFNIMGLL